MNFNCNDIAKWVPTVLEFHDDVSILWGEAGPAAERLFISLAQSGNQIEFSSAALHMFLNLTKSEVTQIHSYLELCGVGVSDEIRHQLGSLGYLDNFLHYEELASLAELIDENKAAERRSRQLLVLLISANYFNYLYQSSKVLGNPFYEALNDLLESVQSVAELIPISRYLPSGFEAGTLVLRPYRLLSGKLLHSEHDRAQWLNVRRNCVGATDARKLVKLNGEVSRQREKLVREKILNISYNFEAFELGVTREPVIAAWVAENFPSEEFVQTGLLYLGENSRHVASPDMVGTHNLCEIKVSTKSLRSCKTTYRDQVQWQMHVTGASKVLFVVENRYTEEIETEWIFRDEHRIQMLVEAADEFLIELDAFDTSEVLEDQDLVEEFGDFLDWCHDVGNTLEIKDTSSFVDSESRNPLPEFEPLTFVETGQALERYCRGQSVYLIAEELSRSTNDVVATLGVCMYDLQGQLINPEAENWGQGWSTEAKEQLATLVRAGRDIDEICEALGRDRLGLLYRIFEDLNTAVPRHVLKTYNVNI